MKYNVGFIKYGHAVIEADDEEKAREIADTYRSKDIEWEDDDEIITDEIINLDEQTSNN